MAHCPGLATLALPLLALPVLAMAAPRHAGDRPAPTPVAEFVLESTKGERVSLYAPRPGRIATAVIFLNEDCAQSRQYAPKVGRLAKEYAEQGIGFFVIDATPGTDATKAASLAKALGNDVALLLDPWLAVAQKLEVTQSATALLVAPDFTAVYRGAIDEQFTRHGDKQSSGHEWLVEAIESLLAGEEVATPAVAPDTTALPAAPANEVTFNDHVAPILHRQCIECHRPGQVGPMALLDYDDAKGWSAMIAEVVTNGRMPPWHADPRYGHFENERRLTDTEKAILAKWNATGAKEGDPAKKPTVPTFADDAWAMGKPDFVVQLAKPEEIKAEGVIDYRYVIVDPQIKEEHWVQSVEIRPTATDVTHHVLAFYIPPGKPPMLTGKDDGGLISRGYFAVQVPGCRPNIFPPGMGKKVEPGCKFIFQLHYTPNGKATTDQTRMAFRWCQTPPAQEVLTLGIFALRLNIPPNDPAATFYADHKFRSPVRLISMFPHMHMRGKAFKFELVSGADDDEQRSVVLDVPKYDFNWQNFYRPVDGTKIAAGESLHCTAVYDNSKDNPYNPDPNKRVTWGDQTFEEMMIGFIDYVEEK